MPELPDLEVFRRYLDSTSLFHVIEDVEISDERVLKDIDAAEFLEALEGNEFTSTRRHGKYLIVELNINRSMILHFGMTGYLKYIGDMSEKPDHERVAFDFSNGYRLSYSNQRLLGQVRLVKNVEAFLEEKEQGLDALDEDFDWETFREKMENRRGMVKSALMNQKIMAGLGNEFSDEILYQLRWHPKRKVKDLSEEELKKLYDTMKSVLQTAIDSNMEYARMPTHFLLPERNDGRQCPNCGNDLERIKVSGRNATYCPNCQSDS